VDHLSASHIQNLTDGEGVEMILSTVQGVEMEVATDMLSSSTFDFKVMMVSNSCSMMAVGTGMLNKCVCRW